jgi:hypothetical protein
LADVDRRFAEAVAAAELLPLCKPCVSNAGLCHWHAEHDRATKEGDGVMPLLVPNSVSVQALSGRWRELHRNDDQHPLSREGEHIRDRKAKKRLRAELRLRRALAGEFTPSRPKVA